MGRLKEGDYMKLYVLLTILNACMFFMVPLTPIIAMIYCVFMWVVLTLAQMEYKKHIK